ncbi:MULTISPECIES: CPBP family intramembrane glutamic endopeptidase [Anaerotruncus]|nr:MULTISPECIES: type II CAAX endopeptidase family protein [Anaerotruncus]MCI8493417.1 CPBP family intramembrane metalloprotease [Anaerotruncus sp.]MCR2025540.1 CPBP family intramembrane metalloprotease [Anaerotruncus colihominis]
MLVKKERVLPAIIFIYFLCFIFRFIEYFLLRTDETFWGEAFIHKLIGIVILFIAVKHYNSKFVEIGFTQNKILHGLLEGLAFGLFVFVPAYLVEIMISIMQGEFENLELYVSSYSVNGTIGNQTGFLFFAICIVGNIINVIMEEGIFRGLFQKILEKKYSFIISSIIAAGLFGLWHIMAPIRSYYDGTMSYKGFVLNSILLVVTSSLVGFEFALMTKLTRSLYMAMGHHFINNTIVNILHVVSSTGIDKFMVVRISIAQTLSFVIILICYIVAQQKEHPIGS